MNLRALVIGAFLTHSLAQAQIPSSIKLQAAASSRSHAEFDGLEAQKLADQAATLPPELKADALIRISEADSVADSIKQKKRLLSEAFEAFTRLHLQILSYLAASLKSLQSIITFLSRTLLRCLPLPTLL